MEANPQVGFVYGHAATGDGTTTPLPAARIDADGRDGLARARLAADRLPARPQRDLVARGRRPHLGAAGDRRLPARAAPHRRPRDVDALRRSHSDVAYIKGVDQAYYRIHGDADDDRTRAARRSASSARPRTTRCSRPTATGSRTRAGCAGAPTGRWPRRHSGARAAPTSAGAWTDADRRARRVRRRPPTRIRPPARVLGAALAREGRPRGVSATCSRSCCPPCTAAFATCCGGGGGRGRASDRPRAPHPRRVRRLRRARRPRPCARSTRRTDADGRLGPARVPRRRSGAVGDGRSRARRCSAAIETLAGRPGGAPSSSAPGIPATSLRSGRSSSASASNPSADATLVHPTAVIPPSCALGAGTVVLAGVVVTVDVQVGAHVRR